MRRPEPGYLINNRCMEVGPTLHLILEVLLKGQDPGLCFGCTLCIFILFSSILYVFAPTTSSTTQSSSSHYATSSHSQ